MKSFPGFKDLALMLCMIGKPEQAEPLYLRALAISEAVEGPAHPVIATRLNNLANLYADSKRFDKAERYLRRAIARRSSVRP